MFGYQKYSENTKGTEIASQIEIFHNSEVAVECFVAHVILTYDLLTSNPESICLVIVTEQKIRLPVLLGSRPQQK